MKTNEHNIENQSEKQAHKNAQHIVFGAGMIGCYLAASMLLVKQNVSIICREKTKNALQHNFSLSDYKGNEFKVDALPEIFLDSEIDQLKEKADFLWLTVKCSSLPDIVDDIKKCITNKSIIICCQNGVATHSVIKQAFPHHNVIRAMVPFSVVSERGGHFHRGSEGHMTIEQNEQVEETVRWLARQLNSRLLPVATSFNMTHLQWAKLQLNLGNALTALADIPTKAMLEDREYRLCLAEMMRELLKVTNKKKIKLPKIANLPNKWIPNVLALPDFLFGLVAQKMLEIDPKVKTSMWWDLHFNRKTEIDYLNAKVCVVGAQVGVETPFNQFVVDLIKEAEQGNRIDAKAFRQQVVELNKYE